MDGTKRDAGMAVDGEEGPGRGDDREILDPVAPGQLPGRAAGNRHLPDMAPVEIVLIAGIDEPCAIGREHGAESFRLTRRQEARRAARGGNGIEPDPAGRFPGKEQLIAGGPDQADRTVENISAPAADAGLGGPHLPPFAGRGIRDPDLPGNALAVQTLRALRTAGDPHEADTLAVRRPDRRLVLVDAGRHPGHRLPGEIIEADQAVRGPKPAEAPPRPP